MDPEEALRRLREGGVVCMLDVPQNLNVGIDRTNWQVGPLFKGVKMIPPGLHFIYYQLTGKHGDTGALTGFFHFFKARDLLVMRWDGDLEQLVFVETDEEISRLRHNLYEMDRFLGPFPDDGKDKTNRFKQWTRHITSSLVSRILPGKRHVITPMSVSYHDCIPQEGGTSPPHDIFFTALPIGKRSMRELLGSQTRDFLDQTAFFRSIITFERSNGPNEILGELELSFVILVLGHNFEGFKQWRSIISLFCHCPGMVSSDSKLFIEFFNVITLQLEECPVDFFDLALVNDNKLVKWFQMLVEDCHQEKVCQSLRDRANTFATFALERFDWDLWPAQEAGEDAPVIV